MRLPHSHKGLSRASSSGFTLIELMVAITIVAILATVGLVIFSNTQKQARDSRRTQDVAAIANALQGKKAAGSIYFISLAGSDFANGNIPTDPKTGGGTTDRLYCLYYLTTVPPAGPPSPQPANWGTTACPGVGGATTVTVNNTATLTLPANSVTSWIVCAALESSTNVVCQQSKL